MTTREPRIAAVVVGRTLPAAEAHARWAWLDGCVVTDGSEPVAPPVDAEWILLVGEDESMHPGCATILREAVGAGAGVFAVPIVTRGLGLAIASRRPLVRLASAGTPVVLGRALELELSAEGHQVRTLPAVLTRERGATLTEAMVWLGTTASTLALVADARVRGHGGLVWHALAAGLRVLTGAARSERLGLGRLVLATLDAYRAVVVHAKLWERRRDQVVDFG